MLNLCVLHCSEVRDEATVLHLLPPCYCSLPAGTLNPVLLILLQQEHFNLQFYMHRKFRTNIPRGFALVERCLTHPPLIPSSFTTHEEHFRISHVFLPGNKLQVFTVDHIICILSSLIPTTCGSNDPQVSCHNWSNFALSHFTRVWVQGHITITFYRTRSGFMIPRNLEGNPISSIVVCPMYYFSEIM